jgi:hypothetical protein
MDCARARRRGGVRRQGGVGVLSQLRELKAWFEGDGVIDDNFLGGLCSLIKFISDIVAERILVFLS